MKTLILQSILLFCFILTKHGLSAEQDLVREIEINGYQIEGAPLLFLHGAISDLRLWEPYRDLVAENRKFLAYTQRYHGIRPWADEAVNYTKDQHVADLISFIQEMQIQPIDIVSHSYSGGVVLQAMLQRPDLFNSGIHYEPAMMDHLHEAPGFGRAVKEFKSNFGPMASALKAGKHDESALRLAEAVFGMAQGEAVELNSDKQNLFTDNGRTVPPMLQMGRWSKYSCEDLSKIKIPNLVIQGSDTHVYYSMAAESLSKCLSNSLLLTMGGAGHGGAGIKTQQFGDIVMSFSGLVE